MTQFDIWCKECDALYADATPEMITEFMGEHRKLHNHEELGQDSDFGVKKYPGEPSWCKECWAKNYELT